MLYKRRDRNDGHILRPREEDLGLVGDAEGIPSRSDSLEHGRRIGRHLQRDREPGIGEVPAILGHVEPGVVGVRVPVERDRDLRGALGTGRRRSWRAAHASKGEPGRDRAGRRDDRAASDRRGRPRRFVDMRCHGKILSVPARGLPQSGSTVGDRQHITLSARSVRAPVPHLQIRL